MFKESELQVTPGLKDVCQVDSTKQKVVLKESKLQANPGLKEVCQVKKKLIKGRCKVTKKSANEKENILKTPKKKLANQTLKNRLVNINKAIPSDAFQIYTYALKDYPFKNATM